MNNNPTYPYNDDFMTFDLSVQQYILTEKALVSRGVDLRSRIAASNTVTPEGVIDNVLHLVSDMIYGYIHAFSADTKRQDYLIACVPSLRLILYNAMLYQAVYVWTNGNLLLSTNQEDREKAIDETAKQWLGRNVPELGCSILYVGV